MHGRSFCSVTLESEDPCRAQTIIIPTPCHSLFCRTLLILSMPLQLQICLVPALVSPTNYITLPSLSFSTFRLFLRVFSFAQPFQKREVFHYTRGMDWLWDQTHREASILPATIYMPSNNQPARPQTHSQLQPQPQLHTMLPPGSKQNEARKYTTKDWDEQRSEITRLYESNTLNSVVELMRERHGLDAT